MNRNNEKRQVDIGSHPLVLHGPSGPGQVPHLLPKCMKRGSFDLSSKPTEIAYHIRSLEVCLESS
jgi:hypothetical protein